MTGSGFRAPTVASRHQPSRRWREGEAALLEPRADPEGGAEPALGLAEVPLLGEVPVDVQPEQVDGEAPAVGGHRVLQRVRPGLEELELLELAEIGAADVEEQHPADAAEADDRRGQQVEER